MWIRPYPPLSILAFLVPLFECSRVWPDAVSPLTRAYFVVAAGISRAYCAGDCSRRLHHDYLTDPFVALRAISLRTHGAANSISLPAMQRSVMGRNAPQRRDRRLRRQPKDTPANQDASPLSLRPDNQDA